MYLKLIKNLVSAIDDLLSMTSNGLHHISWTASHQLDCISTSAGLHHISWTASHQLDCITSAGLHHISWTASHQLDCIPSAYIYINTKAYSPHRNCIFGQGKFPFLYKKITAASRFLSHTFIIVSLKSRHPKHLRLGKYVL